MRVFCLGLSYRTAPVEIRERFALTAEATPAMLGRIREAGLASEAVWLSTCNRVEIYAAAELESVDGLRQWLLDHGRGGAELLADGRLYLLGEPNSLEHLFRVASGLDSMVLGETEILGQLKKAYDLAMQHGYTGSRLNKAFQRAFNVAKQIRTTTAIQRGGISVASVSVELAERLFESFEGRRALLLGAGDTGEKVAKALISRGMTSVLIFNRSQEKAAALAETLGEAAKPCTDWMAEASEVDVIISSTSTPEFVIDVPRLEPLMRTRKKRSLLLVDLAVPRDIDPAVVELPGVFLYNVDDLQMIAQHHLQQREAEKARCEVIIREKVQSLLTAPVGRPATLPGTSPSAA